MSLKEISNENKKLKGMLEKLSRCREERIKAIKIENKRLKAKIDEINDDMDMNIDNIETMIAKLSSVDVLSEMDVQEADIYNSIIVSDIRNKITENLLQDLNDDEEFMGDSENLSDRILEFQRLYSERVERISQSI